MQLMLAHLTYTNKRPTYYANINFIFRLTLLDSTQLDQVLVDSLYLCSSSLSGIVHGIFRFASSQGRVTIYFSQVSLTKCITTNYLDQWMVRGTHILLFSWFSLFWPSRPSHHILSPGIL